MCTLVFFLPFYVFFSKTIVFTELNMQFDLFLEMQDLPCRLLAISKDLDAAGLLTRPMSAIDFDLYEASAFALAKCICDELGHTDTSYTRAYQEQIVLNQIMSEVGDGQRPVGHTFHKVVARWVHDQ